MDTYGTENILAYYESASLTDYYYVRRLYHSMNAVYLVHFCSEYATSSATGPLAFTLATETAFSYYGTLLY
jgi:hypothetical protein